MLDGWCWMEVCKRKNFIQHFIQHFIQRDFKMLDEILDWFAPALISNIYKTSINVFTIHTE